MNEDDEELFADVMLDKRLTATAKLVAYVLLRDGIRRFSNCTIKRNDIAIALSVNHTAVATAFMRLHECRYIDATKVNRQGIWRVNWIYE